jgi:hypothetical protein
MRHERFEPMEYANGDLANELNELFIRIKVWMFEEAAKLRDHHSKPSVAEIDEIHNHVHRILMQDSKPIRRY